MTHVQQVQFQVPSQANPPQFTGYVCVGFAAGRWWSGCDRDSPTDAYERMVDAARLALIPAATVETKLDPDFHAATVACYKVESDPEIRVLVGEED